MIVQITGDRFWTDEKAIEFTLKFFGTTEIIEGEARGADTLSRVVAERLGLKVQKFPADWDKHGKAAGPIRNRQMLGQPSDIVVAFHDDISKSKGTKDCANEAKKRGKKVFLIYHDQDGNLQGKIY